MRFDRRRRSIGRCSVHRRIDGAAAVRLASRGLGIRPLAAATRSGGLALAAALSVVAAAVTLAFVRLAFAVLSLGVASLAVPLVLVVVVVVAVPLATVPVAVPVAATPFAAVLVTIVVAAASALAGAITLGLRLCMCMCVRRRQLHTRVGDPLVVLPVSGRSPRSTVSIQSPSVRARRALVVGRGSVVPEIEPVVGRKPVVQHA